MKHPHRSRIGILPRWQRLPSHLILLTCAASGLGFHFKRELGWDMAGVPAHTWLVWHGVSAALALLVLGSVLPAHVRGGWHARRNRFTGGLMLAVMTALMATGLLLYYGDEAWRDAVVSGHWWIGLGTVAVFPLHLVVGRWLNLRAAQRFAAAHSRSA